MLIECAPAAFAEQALRQSSQHSNDAPGFDDDRSAGMTKLSPVTEMC
jgi:hypothetical protein